MQNSLGPTGKFKEFFLLFFPVLLVTFSSYLFLLLEKVLLARISIKEMEAAVTVAYISQIFQMTCVALAMMAQVSVAEWHGAKNWQIIGPGIWQFIWFSLLSILITIPAGLVYGNFFLAQMSIRDIALPYFHFLLGTNFLYPLGTALSCFYLGRGKTKLVLFSSIGSQVVRLVLATVLILGWEPWFPSLGLMGGAISTLVGQGGLCAVLLYVFFRPENREKYQTTIWKLQPRLFWQSIQPGLLRVSNRVLNVSCWASIAHLMAGKGGDYLVVLSLGGVLSLMLPFLGDAICQTQTILVSQIIGARRYDLLEKVCFPGLSLAFLSTLLLSIPLIMFPIFTFDHLFPNLTTLDPLIIKKVFFGVWVSFVFYTFGYVGIAYILAFKDMYFSLFMGVFNWVNGYLLMYVALEKVAIRADYFWLVHSLMHGSTAIFYFLRAKRLTSRVLVLPKEIKATI